MLILIPTHLALYSYRRVIICILIEQCHPEDESGSFQSMFLMLSQRDFFATITSGMLIKYESKSTSIAEQETSMASLSYLVQGR